MEYVFFFGVQFLLAWLLAALIIAVGGSLLEIAAGDVKELIWKSAMLGVAATGGLLLNLLFVIPMPFIAPWIWPALFVGIALAVLFEIEVAEDWQTIGLFVVLHLGGLMLAGLGLAMVLGGA